MPSLTKNPKYTLVTAMKNEGPYILEWVAHHLSLGFEHIIAVTNDCTDGTDRILERLEKLGHVTHVVNPKVMQRDVGRWQATAFRYVRFLNIYRDSQWIIHADVDEFLCLNSGLKTLNGLMKKVGDTDVISFTSTAFNSGGINDLEDISVLDQFTQRDRYFLPALRKKYDGASPKTLSAVKTLFRNEIVYGTRNNHRPFHTSFSTTGHIWRDGSGRKLGPDFTDTRTKAIESRSTLKFAQLNHYAIRSIEAFIVKVDRGAVASAARLEAPEKYFRNYDTIGEPDLSHSKLSAKASRILQEFKRDPVLSKLHDKAFVWHKNRFQELLELGIYYTLANRLGYFNPDRTQNFSSPSRVGSSENPKSKTANNTRRTLDKPLPIVSSMWTGGKMSFVEIVAMQSFLDHGHDFTLYTLDDVGNVPKGVKIVDAREIYAPEFPTGPGMHHNNIVYSDIFRLIMIRDTGAIWADLDAYCVRPFIFPTEYIFGFEESKPSTSSIANTILGFPKNSAALTQCIDLVLSKNPIPPFFINRRRKRLQMDAKTGKQFGFQDFSRGASGPRLINHYVNQTGEIRYAMPKNVFYPGPRPFRHPLLKPDFPIEQLEYDETVSVHIFAKTKNFINTDFGGVLPKGCYLDTVCKRHGVDPAEFPIPA